MRLIGWPDVLVERKAGRNLQADSAMQLAGNLRGQVKGGLDVSTISQLYGVLSYTMQSGYPCHTWQKQFYKAALISQHCWWDKYTLTERTCLNRKEVLNVVVRNKFVRLSARLSAAYYHTPQLCGHVIIST